MRNYQTVSYEVAEQGFLLPGKTHDIIGLGNYVANQNWRRDQDMQIRREGWVPFRPNMDIDEGEQPWPNAPFPFEHINLIFNARHPSGITATIVGTATRLFRYFALSNGAIYEEDVYEADVFAEEQGEWIVIGEGFSPLGHRWEAKNVGNEVVFNNGYDLPVTYNLFEFDVKPIFELREQGIASVGTIQEWNGMLVCADIREINPSALPGVLSSSSKYAHYQDENNTNRFHWKTIGSAIGAPRRWGSVNNGQMALGSFSVELDYRFGEVGYGDEITVAGAGANGSNLTSRVRAISDDGLTVTLVDRCETAVMDAVVSPVLTDGPNPWSYDLEDDGSAILRIEVLRDAIVYVKETSFIIGSYTGDANSPVSFARSIRTHDSLFWKWALHNMGKDYLVYAGRNDFYRFDLTNQVPVRIDQLSPFRNEIFGDLEKGDLERVFTSFNEITQELWIHRPGKTFCIDQRSNRVSTIDREFRASASIDRPEAGSSNTPPQRWFVMSILTGQIVHYGLASFAIPQFGGARSIYTRLGNRYFSMIETGWESFGDRINEQAIREVMVRVSTQNTGSSMRVRMFRSSHPKLTSGGIVFEDAVFEEEVFESEDSYLFERTVGAVTSIIKTHRTGTLFKLRFEVSNEEDFRFAGYSLLVSSSRDRGIRMQKAL